MRCCHSERSEESCSEKLSTQSLMFVSRRTLRDHENHPTVNGSGAGVPPAVARASCPCAGAGRSRDRGRDARATIFRAVRDSSSPAALGMTESSGYHAQKRGGITVSLSFLAYQSPSEVPSLRRTDVSRQRRQRIEQCPSHHPSRVQSSLEVSDHRAWQWPSGSRF